MRFTKLPRHFLYINNELKIRFFFVQQILLEHHTLLTGSTGSTVAGGGVADGRTAVSGVVDVVRELHTFHQPDERMKYFAQNPIDLTL